MQYLALKTNLLTTILVLINLRWLLVSILDMKSAFWSILIVLISLLSINYRRINLFWGLALIISTVLVVISPNRMIDAWYVILAVLCFKNYPLNKFCRINIYCSIIIYLILAYCLSVGIVSERVMGKAFDAYFESKDFGFGNPNTFAAFLFYCIIYLYYLNQDKKFEFCIFLILISSFSFLYSGSRTYLIAEIVMFLLIIFESISPRPKLKYVIIGLIVFLFLGFYKLLIENSLIMNILLSSRFEYLNMILPNLFRFSSIYGVSVPDEIIIDNAYFAMIIYGGLLYFALFIYLLFKAYVTNFTHQYRLMPIVIPILLSGFFEAGFVVFGSANILFMWLILLHDGNEKNFGNCTYLQCKRVP